MKRLFLLFTIFSTALLCTSCSLFVDPEKARDADSESIDNSNPNSESDMWVSAYLGAWNHYAPPGGNWGNLATEDIDWDAFTHLFYFSLTANEDGSLSKIEEYQTFSPDRINAIVEAAHLNNTPVLYSVGGWGNYPGFRSAIMPENRDNFISNLLTVMEEWGFDGIDIDMEPIKDEQDVENYTAFINELHQELQDRQTPLGTTPLLTAATDWKPKMFAELHEKFDQINLMTYDFSGAWRGWVSWHNSPVFNGGHTFPDSDKPLPSANQEVEKFMEAGVPKEKLGIGIDFYGYIWKGFVIAPRQKWGIQKPTVKPNVPYYQIMDEYYNSDSHKWDDEAKAAYLGIDDPIPLKKQFVSFDDERTIEAKMNYVRNKGIGGTIIWELAGGYRKDQPEGERDLLLQKVKQMLHKNAKVPVN